MIIETDPASSTSAPTERAAGAVGEEPQTAAPAVPARPALAPDVTLVGQMQGSGFQQQQWLVQRAGTFVQVTELLYRVLEQIDGTHTLEEIAEGVTESTEWMVSADIVGQLIQTKLMPLGLIATQDGLAGSSPAVTHGQGGASPLGVNVRMRVIGPRFIDPIAGVLQTLFATPVLIPMLVAIAAAHAWIYLGNRDKLVAGVMQVIYTPGLLLVALGLVLVAAVFHEFGHASALRYGGGQVRGMGAGLYLIYPAFYTDTTDSYRLGRAARVRTDLGGVYFHLIFALGLTGLYLATGQPFLLFAVVLINAEVVRQFIPFVKLDGYWVLADLTGIPDFFSQMGPFLRSVLPLPRMPGEKLPALKPWVKAIFALFIVLTIPVLAVLVFLMLVGLPALIGSTWDSLAEQASTFSTGISQGSVLAIILSLLQMVLLAVPLIGSVYILFALIVPAARGLWRWGRPTLRRRTVAALLTVGGIVALGFLWTPAFAAITAGGPPGVETFTVPSRQHVSGPVTYPQNPPVGGNHSEVWQNCGFYDAPIANENGVHSLEHGAVWITYRPDLPSAQVNQLRSLAHSQSYVLVSPYPGLAQPLVASAWGRQLGLTGADDPRLERFVQAFRSSPNAPEHGGECTGGLGAPK